MLRLHWQSRHGYHRHCQWVLARPPRATEPPAWTGAALAENWLSVKCAYEYVCAQYGMYLYVFCEYLFVSVCIDKLQKTWKLAKCEMCIWVCMCAVWHVSVCIKSNDHKLQKRDAIGVSRSLSTFFKLEACAATVTASLRPWAAGSGSQLYYMNTCQWGTIWPNASDYPAVCCWSNTCFALYLNLNNFYPSQLSPASSS